MPAAAAGGQGNLASHEMQGWDTSVVDKAAEEDRTEGAGVGDPPEGAHWGAVEREVSSEPGEGGGVHPSSVAGVGAEDEGTDVFGGAPTVVDEGVRNGRTDCVGGTPVRGT